MANEMSRVRSGNGPTSVDDGTHPVTNQNRILLALPRKEYDSVFKKLEWVDLPTPSVLHEAGVTIEFGYFINDGLASVLTVMANGKSVEVGLAGKEGFIGTPLVAGYKSSPTRVVMQVGGNGFRVRAQDVPGILRTCPDLERSLQRFSQELAMQATQIGACNRLHDVESRLARWLLMSQDRLGGSDVPLTQQFLAHMLGTRRASVTVAAAALQRKGLITYNRGEVKIRNRAQLEKKACECYKMLTRQSRQWQKESKL